LRKYRSQTAASLFADSGQKEVHEDSKIVHKRSDLVFQDIREAYVVLIFHYLDDLIQHILYASVPVQQRNPFVHDIGKLDPEYGSHLIADPAVAEKKVDETLKPRGSLPVLSGLEGHGDVLDILKFTLQMLPEDCSVETMMSGESMLWRIRAFISSLSSSILIISFSEANILSPEEK
jgi:hypothetical protein